MRTISIFSIFSVFVVIFAISLASAQVSSGGSYEYVSQDRVNYFNTSKFPDHTYQSIGTESEVSVTAEEKPVVSANVDTTVSDSVLKLVAEMEKKAAEYNEARSLRRNDDISRQTIRRERWGKPTVEQPAATTETTEDVVRGWGD